MTKAVFTTKVTPSYKDLPEERYHFPRTYLNYVQQTVGDYIVYYEPRRSSSLLKKPWSGPAVDDSMYIMNRRGLACGAVLRIRAGCFRTSRRRREDLATIR